MGRRRGITLVECLVIVVVLLVLAAILYPVSSISHREPNRRSACLSNLKQCALGAIMYASGYDDTLPNATRWMDLEKPYVKREEIFHDPLDVKPGEYGYAFRERLSDKSLSGLLEPEKVMLEFDSNLTSRNAHSELWSLPQDGRHKNSGGIGFDNITFADGHARAYSASPTAMGNGWPIAAATGPAG